jgi:hypothetical protein
LRSSEPAGYTTAGPIPATRSTLRIRSHRDLMELMAPDVLVVPVIGATDLEEAIELGRRFRPIAREYARRMEWGWQTVIHKRK